MVSTSNSPLNPLLFSHPMLICKRNNYLPENLAKMKLPFFGKKQEKTNTEQEIFLALDIGTEFVKSAIYRLKEDKTAEIIGYSRVPQHSKAMEGAMIINIENVVSSCDIGIGRALAIADKVLGTKCPLPELVTMGIAGELVKGVCILANYEREDPEIPIEEEEIVQVIENVKSPSL
jgi:cell division ATPase FtsA